MIYHFAKKMCSEQYVEEFVNLINLFCNYVHIFSVFLKHFGCLSFLRGWRSPVRRTAGSASVIKRKFYLFNCSNYNVYPMNKCLTKDKRSIRWWIEQLTRLFISQMVIFLTQLSSLYLWCNRIIPRVCSPLVLLFLSLYIMLSLF